jgi:hydrogenase/urease accessory protein HupE
MALVALLLALFALTPIAGAHEARPAYLQLDEVAPGRYEVQWRTPVLSGQRLPVALVLPEGVRDIVPPRQREVPGMLVERRVVVAEDGLAGRRIAFPGLEVTITDVLVRVQTKKGGRSTTLVHPSRPWVDIPAAQGPLEVARAYVLHGVQHILFGFDHLLFVLALVLIVRSGRVLVWTITAFTIGHSITLSLATLGWVHVPGPPVETTIALSIVLLAYEIARLDRGDEGLAARWPWLVAFCFGLLHGFGFAGALSDLGLPQGDIPLALFAFNIGVELGQLAFIAVVLSLVAALRQLRMPPLAVRAARPAAAYAIGILAASWFFERLAGFWT